MSGRCYLLRTPSDWDLALPTGRRHCSGVLGWTQLRPWKPGHVAPFCLLHPQIPKCKAEVGILSLFWLRPEVELQAAGGWRQARWWGWRQRPKGAAGLMAPWPFGAHSGFSITNLTSAPPDR